MNPKVVAAREAAAQAVKDAREIGLQLTTAEEQKLATVGELREKFDKARNAATEAQKALKSAEQLAELDAQHEEFTRPVTNVRARATDTPAAGDERNDRVQHGEVVQLSAGRSRRERLRRERQMREQLEMFNRAGVKNIGDFTRFREAHGDAFYRFVLEGMPAAMATFQEHGFKPQESMALLTSQGDLGGFLAPDEFRAEVIRDLAGFAVMRSICRVETTGSPILTFPTIQSAATDADVYSSGYQGAWKGEGYVTGGTAPTVQNNPKFGQNSTPVHVWAPDAVEITTNLLSDSKADVEGIIAEIIAETLGLDEDAAMLNGNGVGRPMGIMTAGAGITEVVSGDANLITYGGLVDLFTNVPAQYRKNANWLLNSLSYGAILKLKDSQNMPLFPVNSNVNQLWGKTLQFSELMPDVAASANPILFGDFRYYLIADRQELRVQRLNERFAPNVGILPTARVGGNVLRKAAFRKMKISA